MDGTNRILPPNLVEKISSIPEALNANNKVFHQDRKAAKTLISAQIL